MAVADVGAGTGLFTRIFAEKVGADGKVYAVDISKPFLEHIAAESKRLGQTQVHTVQGNQNETTLAPNSVDVVFVADVYHHFEKPDKMLASIHQALRSGGTFVIIEFDKKKGNTEFLRNHIRAPKEVFLKEIESAGFQPLETENAPELKENFFARFRKVDAPAKTSTKDVPSSHGKGS